jgi:CRP/FNR family transcriptional regulator, cyclic AMP receptor protein
MTMTTVGALGRTYADGEIVIRQGDPGDALFVVEEGTVEIVAERDGHERTLRTAGPGELLGEMALFEKEPRSATVRARGQARILTIDRRHFLRRISEDPTLAFRIIEVMAHRVRELSREVAELQERLDRPT